MRRLLIHLAAAVALLLPSVAHAQSGWTGAVLPGLVTVDGARASLGVAFGYCPSLAGFEIEYFSTRGRPAEDGPSAGAVVANVIVHPAARGNAQFFAVGGFGMWGESGTGALSAADFGGGIKLAVLEHVHLRLDYRLFVLGDPESGARRPRSGVPQRFSAGVHLAF